MSLPVAVPAREIILSQKTEIVNSFSWQKNGDEWGVLCYNRQKATRRGIMAEFKIKIAGAVAAVTFTLLTQRIFIKDLKQNAELKFLTRFRLITKTTSRQLMMKAKSRVYLMKPKFPKIFLVQQRNLPIPLL